MLHFFYTLTSVTLWRKQNSFIMILWGNKNHSLCYVSASTFQPKLQCQNKLLLFNTDTRAELLCMRSSAFFSELLYWIWIFKRHKGRLRKLQAGGPHICAWEDHGTDTPGSYAKSHTRWGRQPVQLQQVQTVPDQCRGLLQWSDGIRIQRKSNWHHLSGLVQYLWYGPTSYSFL